MQYVGKVGGYVYNQWNSLNPATLLGAIDIIVIEQPDGSLHCSPFHIRFGKFQIIKPLQKKIDLYVNDVKTDLPMKLGDGGEAFFVFETSNNSFISKSAMTSPVISPVSSPEISPELLPSNTGTMSDLETVNDLNGFDLNSVSKSPKSAFSDDADIESKIRLSDSKLSSPVSSPTKGGTPTPSITSKIAFEKAKKVTQKLNIPSKIDVNGDMVLDMDGYKPNSQKNISNSDEMLKKIFIEELEKLGYENEDGSEVNLWDQIIKMDKDGHIRISNVNEFNFPEDFTPAESEQFKQEIAEHQQDLTSSNLDPDGEKTYFKTLRLTSEQLKQMNLSYGENKLMFKLNQGNSQIYSNLYLWKSTTPIVISDIDGTITKSDALGHVLNFIGKDWTHPGVARLFTDIANNGYNIMYLTARSVGQADTTRAYLQSIVQENNTKLPNGPVILSPDRTMAALKREVILKKPEVFKMSCLNDIKSLYYSNEELKKLDSTCNEGDNKTPFYAGFGNRITDAISYRSVYIPSHRIFTINPDGEVHLELLELSGVKSSYLDIGELVDQYFPPISRLSGYPEITNGLIDNLDPSKAEERFNDVNYWREPLNLSDLSDIEDDELPPEPKSPSLLSIRSFGSGSESTEKQDKGKETRERPKSISSFASPLKGFMRFGSNEPDDSFDYGDNKQANNVDDLDINKDLDDNNILPQGFSNENEGHEEANNDEEEEEDIDDDDDYDEELDDDYIDDDDDEDDEDDEDDDEYDQDEDYDDYDDEVDDEDLDIDSGLPESKETPESQELPKTPQSSQRSEPSSPLIKKASQMMTDLKIAQNK